MCWSCRFLFCIIILYQIEFHIAVIFRCAGHLISVFQVRPSLHCVSNYPFTSNFLVFWKTKFLVYNSRFLNDIQTEFYQSLLQFTTTNQINIAMLEKNINWMLRISKDLISEIIFAEYFQFIPNILIPSFTWNSTNTNFCFPSFFAFAKERLLHYRKT